jgi:hypothetical protein
MYLRVRDIWATASDADLLPVPLIPVNQDRKEINMYYRVPTSKDRKEMNMYYGDPVNLGQPAVSPPPFPPPENTVFPNIDTKMPALSKAAADSVLAVKKLAWFNDIYINLGNAASNSTLALDKSDRVIVLPRDGNSLAKLAPKLIASFAKKAALSLGGELFGVKVVPGEPVEKVAGKIVGKDVAGVLGLLPILLDLLVALGENERKNLVSEQYRSRSMEAYLFKLRFFIRLWLSENSIGGPGSDKNKQAWTVEKLFFQYRKVLGEWTKYLDIERNLKFRMDPYRPTPQGYHKHPADR